LEVSNKVKIFFIQHMMMLPWMLTIAKGLCSCKSRASEAAQQQQ